MSLSLTIEKQQHLAQKGTMIQHTGLSWRILHGAHRKLSALYEHKIFQIKQTVLKICCLLCAVTSSFKLMTFESIFGMYTFDQKLQDWDFKHWRTRSERFLKRSHKPIQCHILEKPELTPLSPSLPRAGFENIKFLLHFGRVAESKLWAAFLFWVAHIIVGQGRVSGVTWVCASQNAHFPSRLALHCSENQK